MAFGKAAALSIFLVLASTVAAHGYVRGIVIGDAYYSGYVVTQFPYMKHPPAVIGWTTTATSLGFVNGTENTHPYTDPNIICHQDATPAQLSAPVAAGGTVELQWSSWPRSHYGPVITYLANCNGNCSTVDKTQLKFFKIDESGLNNYTKIPGSWASNDLIAANNSWTVTIPSSIEPGTYVLRHEIISLHRGKVMDGAQNYPQCINLEITGSGTASPSGTPGEDLYDSTDPGILINIYTTLSTYVIPGPTLWSGASSHIAHATTAPSVSTTVTSFGLVPTPVITAPTTLITSATVVTTLASESEPPSQCPI